VIARSARLYSRSALRLRDVERLLAQRAIRVSYAAARRWLAKWRAVAGSRAA
jgi:transposase-like protein